MIKNFIDPFIIKILFKLDTDEEALEIYSSQMRIITNIVEQAIKTYLDERGSDVIYEPDENLKSTIEQQVNHYIQTIYDSQLNNLSNTEKEELEEYIDVNNQTVEYNLGILSQINQVSKNILDQYNTLKANSSINLSKPTINLGGNITKSVDQMADHKVDVIDTASHDDAISNQSLISQAISSAGSMESNANITSPININPLSSQDKKVSEEGVLGI